MLQSPIHERFLGWRGPKGNQLGADNSPSNRMRSHWMIYLRLREAVDRRVSESRFGTDRMDAGIVCSHVTWLGLQSAQDWQLVQRAVSEDWVFVTNNTTFGPTAG